MVLPLRAAVGTGDISVVVLLLRSVRKTVWRSPTRPWKTTQRPSDEIDGSLASSTVAEARCTGDAVCAGAC
jgi:hypothetical protein